MCIEKEKIKVRQTHSGHLNRSQAYLVHTHWDLGALLKDPKVRTYVRTRRREQIADSLQ